jgi:hypothetical protein
MLKKVPNFVLGLPKSSTYPRGDACGVDFIAVFTNDCEGRRTLGILVLLDEKRRWC